MHDRRTEVLWERIYREIAQRISQGAITTGDKLPSIQALCTEHAVSHMTIRSALARLIADGLITSRPGSGYYCSGPAPATSASVVSVHSAETPTNQPHVALILPGANPFFIDIIQGAEARLHANGYRMIVAVTGHDGTVLAQRMCDLLDSVRGFIVAPGRGGYDYRAWVPLLERHTPFVFIDHWIPGIAAPLVATDNFLGGKLGTAYCCEQGHERIWLLSERGFSSMDERVAGYRQALREANRPCDPRLMLAFDEIGRAATELIPQRLAADLQIGDVVFALNEDLALGAYQAIRSRGWRPGADVAVLGFDDTSAAYFDPPLTTIAQDLHGLGSCAADKLLERIAAPLAAPDAGVRLAPRLISRHSFLVTTEAAS